MTAPKTPPTIAPTAIPIIYYLNNKK